jgi:hypothetical protein
VPISFYGTWFVAPPDGPAWGQSNGIETSGNSFTADLSFFLENEFHATFFEHKTFSPHHL